MAFKFGFTGFKPIAELVQRGVQEPAPPSCVGTADGSHCWELSARVLLSNPPQTVEQCKHCPLTRTLVSVTEHYRYSG